MAKRRKSADANCILGANENDQLAAAIAASLKETTAQSTSSKVLATNSDSDDSEFFEECYSADSEDSNSAAPTLSSFSLSKTYAKLVELTKTTETNTAKVESEKCEDAGSSNGEIYLGSKEDPLSSIMIRFPDGNRVTKEIPCSSLFLVSFFDLSLYCGPKVRFK